ncbi:tellurite resistance/C4-dicarboxylate transporter family protein [Mycobacterium sp. CPCC 205372]|uniref:Tellurite resistance/C4-dicarboxylate transporter family protein n=1 Tax=Mycobacterium hippophais TaxID=3016340 RepID=A0ABT4PN86_9MYCO|nr:tellurite resistance/C4-dicarboxylate transporter family protein [Mycobacterium hippophais]MCZ8378037.1 tellurite resistance/C4-dicarboxylate transporter family protein [Mycobacterium hippophais]
MRPDAFAAVMATGIVSIAAADHGYGAVSAALAVLAVVALPVLMFLAAMSWRRDGWDLREIDTAVGLFTYVAACAVLAARFSDHEAAVWVLGTLALLGWVSLMPIVVSRMWRLRWSGLRGRAHGAWELVSVATSGLAIVFVALGILFWGTAFWLLALCWYLVMTSLVVWRIGADPAMRRGVPPDHWILMGGLAVSTLAGDHLHHALPPGPFADAVKHVTIGTWLLATLWIVPLLCVGWRRVRAWPAVFPLGMYASATFAMYRETGWRWLDVVSAIAFWIALAVWLLTVLRFRRAFVRSPIVSAPESRD